jgi:hypothetical protein
MKHALIAAALLASITAAHAGRPLMVDDANVNEKGAGHVETWFEKGGSDKSFTISPAYGIAKGWEVSAAYNRDQPFSRNYVGLGAKYQISKPQANGCHSAVSMAYARASGNGAMGFNLIGTCSLGGPDIHVNLGAARESATNTNTRSLGVALEKEFGLVTGHFEAVAIQHEKPIFQIGARRAVAKSWQLDGTIGRQGGRNIFSLGTKYSF